MTLFEISRTNQSRHLVYRLFPPPDLKDTNTSIRFNSADIASCCKLCYSSNLNVVKIPAFNTLFSAPIHTEIRGLFIGQNKISCNHTNQKAETHFPGKIQVLCDQPWIFNYGPIHNNLNLSNLMTEVSVNPATDRKIEFISNVYFQYEADLLCLFFSKIHSHQVITLMPYILTLKHSTKSLLHMIVVFGGSY